MAGKASMGEQSMLKRHKKREASSPSGLKSKIVQYLEQHPEAKDTILGIARWWVSEQPDRVEAVLEELVEKGLIEKKNFSSFILYSLSVAFKKGKKKSDQPVLLQLNPIKGSNHERENSGRR
jgi:hypothetical protein